MDNESFLDNYNGPVSILAQTDLFPKQCLHLRVSYFFSKELVKYIGFVRSPGYLRVPYTRYISPIVGYIRIVVAQGT